MTDYATHPGWLALLRGICDELDADLPRLVAADWLEDRGDKASAARAAFIRVQCEWETLAASYAKEDPLAPRSVGCRNCRNSLTSDDFTPTPRCRGEYCRPLRRERDLLARHRIDWDAEVLAVPRVVWRDRDNTFTNRGMSAVGIAAMVARDRLADADARWLFSGATLHYSRGFVSRVTLPPAAFIAYGAALFAAAPVERVTLPDPDGGGFVFFEVEPPGDGRGWRAGFHRRGDADAFETAEWASRVDMAAGVVAAVAVALDLGHLVAGSSVGTHRGTR